MTPDQTAHVRAHVAAVSKLLLGNKTMNPGLMILAGDPLSPLNRIEFGRTAVEAQVDLVYMEFAIGETGVLVMTGMKKMLRPNGSAAMVFGHRVAAEP